MSGPKKFILVVEDDLSIRRTLQEALELEGYDVATAADGIEGLEQLRRHPAISLVLLDMMMPLLDGRGFLAEVLKDAALAPIPVIVVSATPDHGATLGAKAFLKKPVDLDLLLQMVHQHTSA